MTAKEYLSQIRRIQTRLSAMAEQLICLRSAAEYISPQLSDMPRPATRNVHKSENAIASVVDWEQQMEEQFNRLADINATINAVTDPRLQSVLVKRYVDGKPWADISEEMFVGIDRLYQLHRAALGEVDGLMKQIQ